MNKAHLIEAVAERTGKPHKVAAAWVDTVLDTIARELADGGKVAVTGFGTFEAAQRPAQTRRNPQTGEPVHVPAVVVPKFRAGQRLNDLVSGRRTAPALGLAIGKDPKGTHSPVGGAR